MNDVLDMNHVIPILKIHSKMIRSQGSLIQLPKD